MRLLVFGGWGQLGSDLWKAASGRHELERPRHQDVDVRDPAAVGRTVQALRPDAVVNAAAFHKVEACEEDPAWAFAVNAVGALNVARGCEAAGSRCVFVSTDYVFDGEREEGYSEDEPTWPVNVYGASKVAGEGLVRMVCPDSLIVRGAGLFGRAGSSGKGGNFVETMLAKAARGEPISVVDDIRFSPTSTSDMAERMLLLLERAVPPGTYHVVNAGSCSWYEFAQAIMDVSGVTANLSARHAGEGHPRRPRCSVLLDTKSSGLGLPASRHWREGLRSYLRNDGGRDQGEALGPGEGASSQVGGPGAARPR